MHDLTNIDPEDIGDVLVDVERSFDFKFSDSDFKGIGTFGQLCDMITAKVEGENVNDCTTQQGFYKLREAILAILPGADVITSTDLETLFPRNRRRKLIRSVERKLGFKTKILQPKSWIVGFLAILFLASFVAFFFYWKAALAGFVFSFVAYHISFSIGKEFTVATVGDFAAKISREHYKKTRRHPTVNRNEIASKVRELFMMHLSLDQQALQSDAIFNIAAMPTEIRYTNGDATNPTAPGNKIIVHICNDIGGWGAGFVLAISKKWKKPEQQYRQWYQSKENFALGAVQLVKVEDDVWVANIIGQRDVRSDKSGRPPIRYDAVAAALRNVAEFAKEINASIHMPRIGCGLAGGTWDKMEPIVTDNLSNQNIPVTVYDFA